MAILFAQYWDVVENKEAEYQEFILSKYIPTYEKTGLRLAGAYYVVVGAGPRIVGVSTTDDLLAFQQALGSDEYAQLLEELFPLIRNYSSKLYVSYGPIKVERYDIQVGVWKLNQYFNILPGMEKAYRQFLETEFISGMEKLGVSITNIWKAVIGSGPFILVEGTSGKLEEIAKAIDSDEYRMLTRTLKSRYVMDYQSRILAPTRRVELPYFIRGLTAGL